MNCGQVADSDGVIHRGPDIARLEARRRRYRRRMARQRKNSNRRAVTRMRLRKTQRKLRQARHNWRHHVSRTLANTAHTVVVEDLRTRSMTRSAKGTVDSPGFERAGQSRTESLDSRYRVEPTTRHARIQGGRSDCRTGPVKRQLKPDLAAAA